LKNGLHRPEDKNYSSASPTINRYSTSALAPSNWHNNNNNKPQTTDNPATQKVVAIKKIINSALTKGQKQDSSSLQL
jgi:hypothetical protein